MSNYGLTNEDYALLDLARAGNAPWPQITETAGPDVGCVAGYSDVRPMVVTRRQGRRVWAREARAVLMNPPGSDAPDKLDSIPTGFAAHVSGTQRWEFFEPSEDTPEEEFSLRKSGRLVKKGVADTRGNSHAELRLGRLRAHYDFNF